MKKAMLAMIMVFALVLATAGSAALVVSSATLGSISDQRGKTVTTTFTVQNTANATVTGLTPSTTANAKYNVSFSGLPSFLNASQTVTVTVALFIAKDHPAVNDKLVASSVNVGKMVITGTEAGASVTSTGGDLFVQAENKLIVKRVRVTVKGGNSDTVRDGDKVKNLKPSDKFDAEIEVQNKFSRDSDLDFRDVRVDMKSDDSDVDVDNDDSLNVGSDSTESIRFSSLEIQDDARDGTARVTVTASGQDDNGALHGDKIEFRLEINRESHEIRIDSATISPSTILCEGDRTLRVDARVTNTGRNNENDVVIELDAPGLNFNEKKNIGDLDEDDSSAASFTVPVAKTVKPGAYQLTVNTYWEQTVKSATKLLNVVVADCAVQSTPVITPVITPVQTPVQPVTPPVVAPVTPVAKAPVKASSFMDSPAYVALLSVAAVIVLLALVFLVVKLARRE